MNVMEASGKVDVNENSIIRDDRVWEYVMTDNTGMAVDFYIWKMKFDGTEVKNGKSYSIFKAFDGYKISREIHSDKISGETVYSFTLEEHVYPKYNAYIREEDQKVYAITPPYNSDMWDEGLFGKTVKETEYLLYDFSLKEGDSFTYVVCQPDTFWNWIENEDYEYLRLIYKESEVSSIRKLLIGGEEVISVDSDDWLANYVGGIGWTKSLLFVNIWEYQYSGQLFDFELNNVYDNRGNILYQGANITKEGLGYAANGMIPDNLNDIRICDNKIMDNGGSSSASVMIRSLSGENILLKSVKGEETIDISDLAKGIYLIELKSESGNKVIKYLK
ncbi:MAG: T9SS type A sorting domain-containing protein [Muribaculaceae bacterium]|nr:T9SS type A sorting domain-containing protein [Muribaculaceae bacterium]